LLRGNGLQNALDWRAKQVPTSSWAQRYHADFPLAISFLDESRKAHDAEIERLEQEKLEEEERRRRELRRTRIFAAILAGALILSLMTAAYAWQQQRTAVENGKKLAEESEKNRYFYYSASMNLARSEFDSGNVERAYELLDSFLPKAIQSEKREPDVRS